MPRILGLCGSDRTGSWNRILLEQVASLARNDGAEVSILPAGELAMPLYNADDEAAKGLPAEAASLRQHLSQTDGLIVSCPEYNGFVTPLLLNAIDWATRSEAGQADPGIFANKLVLICSTSPGGFGGMRSAGHLRTLMSGIGCWVMPQGIVVPAAGSSFNEAGEFTDENLMRRASTLTTRFVEACGKMA